MDEIPALPFKKIFSYLSLKDCLRSRAVSRGWRERIDNLKRKTLFYSELKRGFICGKRQLICGSYAQNFIGSPKFEPLFISFSKTVFSNLRHLRIFKLTVKDSSSFFQAINTFGELEELDLRYVAFDPLAEFQLNLPCLKSFQAKELTGLDQLTFDAPKLQRIHMGKFPLIFDGLKLKIVHVEPVEHVVIYDTHMLDLTNLSNLKYLYCVNLRIEAGFLEKLGQLKELNFHRYGSPEIFDQKQAYGREDLKIYYCGFLLNQPNELHEFPEFDQHSPSKEQIQLYAENSSRLADQIRDYWFVWYSHVEAMVSAPVDFWKKFVDLHQIKVDNPIGPENVQQFLQFLKKLDCLKSMMFYTSQPQALFDQLPDYCSLQDLSFFENGSIDPEFMLRFKDLTSISFDNPVDTDFVQRVFEELEFIVTFCYTNSFGVFVTMSKRAKEIEVLVGQSKSVVTNLDDAISLLKFEGPAKAKRLCCAKTRSLERQYYVIQ